MGVKPSSPDKYTGRSPESLWEALSYPDETHAAAAGLRQTSQSESVLREQREEGVVTGCRDGTLARGSVFDTQTHNACCMGGSLGLIFLQLDPHPPWLQ